MPTDDFLGKKEPTPEERPFLRWVFLIRYPDGVALNDGEKPNQRWLEVVSAFIGYEPDVDFLRKKPRLQ